MWKAIGANKNSEPSGVWRISKWGNYSRSVRFNQNSTGKRETKFTETYSRSWKSNRWWERNIVEEKLNQKELHRLIQKSGKDINRFFNTSGLKYRELKLKDKIQTMSYEEKLQILSTDGMLVKRPLLELDDIVLVGFKEIEWNNI